jgi:hypothetical protein
MCQLPSLHSSSVVSTAPQLCVLTVKLMFPTLVLLIQNVQSALYCSVLLSHTGLTKSEVATLLGINQHLQLEMMDLVFSG